MKHISKVFQHKLWRYLMIMSIKSIFTLMPSHYLLSILQYIHFYDVFYLKGFRRCDFNHTLYSILFYTLKVLYLPHIHTQFRITNSTNLDVFWLREEVGVLGGNPCTQREIMDTPHRKASARTWTISHLAVRKQCKPIHQWTNYLQICSKELLKYKLSMVVRICIIIIKELTSQPKAVVF